MADQAPVYARANDVVVGLIERFAVNLEEALDGDVLVYKGPLLSPIEEEIRNALDARTKKRRRLVVVLETEGGYLEVVVRVVDTLRHHYPDSVDFVVPDHAFSAGTVLVLSGDEIYMDYFSVLGPTDPQDEGQDGRLIPAWGYVERYDELIAKAEQGTITQAETILLVQGFDQGRLQMYLHTRELAKTLLKEWLPRYKFRDWKTTETKHRKVTSAMKEKRAQEIADILSDTARWHAHGRGINKDVLQRVVGLRINDFGANTSLNKAIRDFNGLLVDFAAKQGYPTVLYTPGRMKVPFGLR